jgi:hypothetical protein
MAEILATRLVPGYAPLFSYFRLPETLPYRTRVVGL